MARIANETIEEVNARTSIVTLVGEYTRLEQRGSDWWGCCPFHSEKTPSFSVSPDQGLYYCFGCNRGGDIFSFVEEIEGVEFVDALKLLADRAGVSKAAEISRSCGPIGSAIAYKTAETCAWTRATISTKTATGTTTRRMMEPPQGCTATTTDRPTGLGGNLARRC